MRFRAWFFIVTEGVQSIWNPGNQEKISGWFFFMDFWLPDSLCFYECA